MIKRIIGIVFFIIAFLLTSSIIIQIPQIISTIHLLKSEGITSSERGVLTGELFARFIILIVVFILLKVGIKWVRNKRIKS